jgi:hypothetical protein
MPARLDGQRDPAVMRGPAEQTFDQIASTRA